MRYNLPSVKLERPGLKRANVVFRQIVHRQCPIAVSGFAQMARAAKDPAVVRGARIDVVITDMFFGQ